MIRTFGYKPERHEAPFQPFKSHAESVFQIVAFDYVVSLGKQMSIQYVKYTDKAQSLLAFSHKKMHLKSFYSFFMIQKIQINFLVSLYQCMTKHIVFFLLLSFVIRAVVLVDTQQKLSKKKVSQTNRRKDKKH